MLRVKNFFNIFPKQIFFFESYQMRPAIFGQYSISRLTWSDWVPSKTQIVRAFRIKFWKMALAETPVVTFSVF